MNQKIKPEPIFQGGLMRCCLATLYEHLGKATKQSTTGDVVECQYCTSSMIKKDDGWYWNHQ